MSAINIEGAINIESDTHTVEYEPGAMTGAQTLHLRGKGGNKNVPIFVAHIDDVIEMLRRGKQAIEALENYWRPAAMTDLAERAELEAPQGSGGSELTRLLDGYTEIPSLRWCRPNQGEDKFTDGAIAITPLGVHIISACNGNDGCPTGTYHIQMRNGPQSMWTLGSSKGLEEAKKKVESYWVAFIHQCLSI